MKKMLMNQKIIDIFHSITKKRFKPDDMWLEQGHIDSIQLVMVHKEICDSITKIRMTEMFKCKTIKELVELVNRKNEEK